MPRPSAMTCLGTVIRPGVMPRHGASTPSAMPRHTGPRPSAMTCLGMVIRPSECLGTVPRPSAMTCLGTVIQPSECLGTVPRPSAFPRHGRLGLVPCHA